MTKARSPGQPARNPARSAGPKPSPGRPLPAAGPGHKGQEAPGPHRGPRSGRDLTWPSPRHALGLAPLTTTVREPGQGQSRGAPPQAALAALGVPHSWRDPEQSGAAIFLHSNTAAAAALARRRQRGTRMRRARRRGRARTHTSARRARAGRPGGGAIWGRGVVRGGGCPGVRTTLPGAKLG